MTPPTEMVARTFDFAYRNAGGQGDGRSTLEVRAPAIKTSNTDRRTFRRLHIDEGIGDVDLSANRYERTMPDGQRGLPRSDLRLIAIAGASLARAERRRSAIANVTGEADPEWSLTAHPVLKAAIRLLDIPLKMAGIGQANWREVGNENLAEAVAGYDFENANASIKAISGHLCCPFLEEKRTGMRISQNHGRTICRITLMDVSVPETVAASMKGRPISDVLDHPLVDLVPDLVIHRLISPRADNPDPNADLMSRFKAKMTKRPTTIIEVDARSVPLASAPEGADTSWQRLPSLHHNEIQ